MTLNKKALENTFAKGKNAGNQHFLLFPQCFQPYQKGEIVTLAKFNLLSASAFNLFPSKTLLFGKGLTQNNNAWDNTLSRHV